jgi:hypothetical protein
MLPCITDISIGEGPDRLPFNICFLVPSSQIAPKPSVSVIVYPIFFQFC